MRNASAIVRASTEPRVVLPVALMLVASTTSTSPSPG
jgi:hypothetical protein